MLRRRDLLLGLLAGIPARVLLAQSWPQFRGPGSRGIAVDDPRLPVQWSTRENILWRFDIPGRGWASPVVWNDQIFLQTAINAAGEPTPATGTYGARVQHPVATQEHRWMVHSIDLGSGKQRWATEIHKGVPKTARHPKNSQGSETPVTDGERLYVHVGDLGTYCLDMAGKVLWSKEWPPVETRWGYGTASSPVLHEGRLYLQNDNEAQSYIVALDKLTGREILESQSG